MRRDISIKRGIGHHVDRDDDCIKGCPACYVIKLEDRLTESTKALAELEKKVRKYRKVLNSVEINSEHAYGMCATYLSSDKPIRRLMCTYCKACDVLGKKQIYG